MIEQFSPGPITPAVERQLSESIEQAAQLRADVDALKRSLGMTIEDEPPLDAADISAFTVQLTQMVQRLRADVDAIHRRLARPSQTARIETRNGE